MNYAVCAIDSTRDVVLSIYGNEDAAMQELDQLKEKVPTNALSYLMYRIRRVDNIVSVGDRLRQTNWQTRC